MRRIRKFKITAVPPRSASDRLDQYRQGYRDFIAGRPQMIDASVDYQNGYVAASDEERAAARRGEIGLLDMAERKAIRTIYDRRS